MKLLHSTKFFCGSVSISSDDAPRIPLKSLSVKFKRPHKQAPNALRGESSRVSQSPCTQPLFMSLNCRRFSTVRIPARSCVGWQGQVWRLLSSLSALGAAASKLNTFKISDVMHEEDFQSAPSHLEYMTVLRKIKSVFARVWASAFWAKRPQELINTLTLELQQCLLIMFVTLKSPVGWLPS